MDATIITDASWCPDSQAAGWACWIRYDDQTLVKHAAAFKKPMPSSEHAEFCAVVNSVAIAILKAPAPLGGLLIQTDCMNVVFRMRLQSRALLALELPKLKIPEVVLVRHVKGHVKNPTKARNWCNNWCDAEAKKMMREARP